MKSNISWKIKCPSRMSHVSSIHIFTERQSTYNRRYRTENGKENCIHIIYTGIKIQMANLSHWRRHFLIRQGHEEIIRFVKHDISHWIWGSDNSHNLSLPFQPQIKQWDILVTLGKVQHIEWSDIILFHLRKNSLTTVVHRI